MAKRRGDIDYVDLTVDLRDERPPYKRMEKKYDKIPQKIVKIANRSRDNYYKTTSMTQ